MKVSIALALSLLLIGCASAANPDPLQAFPPAESGMTRHVLQLPARDDENAARLELQIGKTVSVDAINRYHFGGRLETVAVSGWGYTRYVLKQLGPMAGTLMAPREGEPPVQRFVTLGGEPFLLRYNSKLPVVVYVPDGVEVRYRLWQASEQATAVPQG